MKFNLFKTVEEFAKQNLELLKEREWQNCLMVGNCIEGIEKGIDGWLLANVTEGNQTELIILYRKPWKLLMYSPTDNTSDELYKFAAEEIYRVDKELLGVNCEKEVANKFAKYYCEIANKKYKIHTPLRILVLEQLNRAVLDNDIVIRKAEKKDKEILKKFIKNFEYEALHEEYAEEQLENKYNEFVKRGYYIVEDKGEIVSQAVYSRKLGLGKSIGGVYTPKEHRGKKYAFNLVYRLSEMAINNGAKYCVLYTDDQNPISNHIYEKIGYKRMVDCEDIEFYEI